MHFYSEWARDILHGPAAQPLAFYGLPGYPYLLAFLYRIVGENPFIPALIQAGLDAGTAVLIYQICRHLFTTSAGLVGMVAALGWACFVPAQAYSIVLMPTAWFVFVFWLIVWRIARSESPPGALESFLIALLIGLTATAVATILAIVPLFAIALISRCARRPGGLLPLTKGFCALALGLAIGTSPCWIHNYWVAKDPVLLSAHSGINFWIGNNPEANGYPRFPPGLRAGQAAMLQDSITQAEAVAGRQLKRSEVSRFWSSKARAYIAEHFGDWLRLLAQKIRNFWSAFQYDDLSIITSLREQGVIFPGISFGIVAALAIPGILLSWLGAPRSRWIFGAVVLSMLSLLSVFVTERYRLVAVPGLLIFAASGLAIFWQDLTTKPAARSAVYLLVLLLSTAFIAWPQRNPSLWALDAYNSGWQALESDNLPFAEKKLAIAYAYVPENSETLFALGNLRFAQSNPVAAQSFYHSVLELDPKHKGAFNNLGVIALEAKRFPEAEQWLRRAEQIDPRNSKTHFLLAKALLGKSDLAGARAEIDTAIELSSNQPEFSALKREIEETPQ